MTLPLLSSDVKIRRGGQMVFDLKYKRLLCGVQQNLITEHWELLEGKSRIICGTIRI